VLTPTELSTRGVTPSGPTPAVELQHASARVGGRTVWSDVELEIRRGELVALLGPNGAGKSTMIKAILGQHPLAAGSVRVLGRRAGQANAAIGYLPQRRSFDASLRVRAVDVVRLGLDGTRWGTPLPGARLWSTRARDTRARVSEVVDLVGATAYAHRPVGRLSGGEQQRILIAQALAARPDLLLLDEPLDSLDLPNQSAIATLIASICREEGVTVVMVAHDVNPILHVVDRVVYIAEGGVAAGPPSDVITTATLSRLYGSSVEVLTAADGRLVVVGQPDAPALHSDRHAR
jgi:zinc/manganese transport system ATP-binding protein